MEGDTTVFVVDDDDAARESVMALVGLQGLPAKGFASAKEFLDQFDASLKGCLVVDVRMAGTSGLDLLEQLAARHSTLPVVVITGYADVPMAVRAMQMGAVTFLEKPCQEQELWQGIRNALELESQLHRERSERAEVEARLKALSDEELLVFRKMTQGQGNKVIAADLDIGLRTVELRRSNVMRKMQAASLPDLVRMAILVGHLQPEVPLN